MSKKKSPISRKPKSSRKALIIAIALTLLSAGSTASLGVVIGRRGIPAARQEGCVAGAGRLFLNMSGGQEAPADKLAEFCAGVLSK